MDPVARPRARGRAAGGGDPAYVKLHSQGEFVFDWSWAEAYARHGLEYYPKLVSAIPFTPSTGPRLLVHPGADGRTVRRVLAAGAVEVSKAMQASSFHWLFPRAGDAGALDEQRPARSLRDASSTGRTAATATSGTTWMP